MPSFSGNRFAALADEERSSSSGSKKVRRRRRPVAQEHADHDQTSSSSTDVPPPSSGPLTPEEQETQAEEESGSGTRTPPEVPENLLCPIDMALFHDPVVAASGRTYDRRTIRACFDRAEEMKLAFSDPMTRQPLDSTKLLTNWSKRDDVQLFLDEHPGWVPDGWDSRALAPPGEFQVPGRAGGAGGDGARDVDEFPHRRSLRSVVIFSGIALGCAAALALIWLLSGGESSDSAWGDSVVGRAAVDVLLACAAWSFATSALRTTILLISILLMEIAHLIPFPELSDTLWEIVEPKLRLRWVHVCAFLVVERGLWAATYFRRHCSCDEFGMFSVLYVAVWDAFWYGMKQSDFVLLWMFAWIVAFVFGVSALLRTYQAYLNRGLRRHQVAILGRICIRDVGFKLLRASCFIALLLAVAEITERSVVGDSSRLTWRSEAATDLVRTVVTPLAALGFAVNTTLVGFTLLMMILIELFPALQLILLPALNEFRDGPVVRRELEQELRWVQIVVRLGVVYLVYFVNTNSDVRSLDPGISACLPMAVSEPFWQGMEQWGLWIGMRPVLRLTALGFPSSV